MDQAVEAAFACLRSFNQAARQFLDELDPTLLHVAPPAPETNSIAVLLHHAFGSQMQIVRQVAEVPAPRDRAAEFRIGPNEMDIARLREELDAADRLLAELGPRIGPEQLQAMIERSGDRVFTGLHWLIVTYGHVCGHLSDAQITRHWLIATRR